MKNFFQFLTETTATQQAARLGLQGDGHGGWYKDGEFVAKTEKGRLKFYNKRQGVGKDPAQTETEKNISDPNFVDPALQQQQAPAPQPVAQEAPPVNFLPVEKTKGTLTIAFGRFNPPHLGHLQLMDTAAASAEQEGSDYMIVPSRSQDKKKNPLDPDTKVSLMRSMFPQHSERIMNDASTRTNLYAFDNIEVVSAGDRDPDSEGVEGLSASRMRLAAAEGDFKTFRLGMPPEMRPKDARAVFDTVRAAMGIQDQVAEVWEIAPKFDQRTLRENYLSEAIFKIGQLVENLNTGLIGRIIRRGTNYLICVTEDHIMFKSWIKDVMEAKLTSRSGVTANQRLVGTDAYRKYVESMVPGRLSGREFINKYRKSK